jgi:nuclear pore complex protein Nup54
MSLFGGQQKPAENKFGTLFGSTTAPAGGLFGSQQQQQTSQPSTNAGQSIFGTSQQNAGSSLFGGQQQQQQQQQPQNTSILGGLGQSQQLPQQQQPAFPSLEKQVMEGLDSPRTKSVPDQIAAVRNKWEPENPDSVFQYYLYNQAQPGQEMYYTPQSYEDPKKWEEALAKKPSPHSVPILIRGFRELNGRIAMQDYAVNGMQRRLHEINKALEDMKNKHELDVASRITESKRRHIVFTQRCLTLATKVQILRNRGYAMDSAEEELKKKLVALEKMTFDPVLGGRQEEIWARMSGVRERARIIQDETEKLGKTIEGQQNGEILSEDEQNQLEKLLKGYDKQLEHLKNMVDETKKEYDEWLGEKS